MSTISIPLTQDLETFINREISLGKAETKAAVVRKALRRLAEEEAVQTVLRAEQEPTLSGDLTKLARQIG